MSIFKNNNLDPFGTNSLFADINNTNQQINSMNLPSFAKEEEEKKRKKAEQIMKLRNLADTLNMVNAQKSGNAQAAAMYSNRRRQRQLDEEARLKKAEQENNNKLFMKSLEGTPYEELGKSLNANEIRKVIVQDKINQFTQSGKNSDTANMKNYESLIAIINDPTKTKEEKDIARRVYGVQGKTKQEFVSDSISDLLKQKDLIGNPVYNQNNVQEAIPQLEKLYDLIFQNEETVSKYKIEELPNSN